MRDRRGPEVCTGAAFRIPYPLRQSRHAGRQPAIDHVRTVDGAGDERRAAARGGGVEDELL